MDVFRERLLEQLKKREMHQQDLADKTEITPATISRYITGKRKPSGENINRIAKELGISADYLLGITNNPTTNDDQLNTGAKQKLNEYLKDKDEDYAEFVLNLIKGIDKRELAKKNKNSL
ncbi:helix-turn-helix domain-containing protein [Cellulosilyticum sp. I15G10I2]|uniref:helix-turn-helix domain-containing protein n=1 Tax=Cellulosilyticum sp. I15G10I2 TaxID=1892843 RepID=UPI00085C123B|nr:helix-turn-helix domain-containing protein [Cellulosilyticum sp. I15G10I2]